MARQWLQAPRFTLNRQNTRVSSQKSLDSDLSASGVPETFERGVSLAQILEPFDALKVQELDHCLEEGPVPQPAQLKPHDISPKDWERFVNVSRMMHSYRSLTNARAMQDLRLVWVKSMQQPRAHAEGQPERSCVKSVIDMLDEWKVRRRRGPHACRSTDISP